jgi:2-(3-amino-3-carboxypropyl)histidine synthase
MNIDFELDRIVKEIKDNKAKRVALQLPDGLKPKAKEIVEHIEKNTSADVMIWLGTCFGACDVPTELEKLGVDLLIQIGHAEYKK